jgi:hypothetical protein
MQGMPRRNGLNPGFHQPRSTWVKAHLLDLAYVRCCTNCLRWDAGRLSHPLQACSPKEASMRPSLLSLALARSILACFVMWTAAIAQILDTSLACSEIRFGKECQDFRSASMEGGVKVAKLSAKEERPLKGSALGAGSEGAERVRGRTSIQSRIDPALP